MQHLSIISFTNCYLRYLIRNSKGREKTLAAILAKMRQTKKGRTANLKKKTIAQTAKKMILARLAATLVFMSK